MISESDKVVASEVTDVNRHQDRRHVITARGNELGWEGTMIASPTEAPTVPGRKEPTNSLRRWYFNRDLQDRIHWPTGRKSRLKAEGGKQNLVPVPRWQKVARKELSPRRTLLRNQTSLLDEKKWNKYGTKD